MTIPRLPDRDGDQVDALVADRYLDALLAAGDRRANDAPSDGTLAPELRATARLLRRTLVRVHPSFRFEERLATRLAGLAAAQAGSDVEAAGGGALIPFPVPAQGPAGRRAGPPGHTGAGASLPDPLLPAILAGTLDPTDAAALDRATPGAAVDRRPLIVGGAAITSAAISIVGVAFVAWRASRPGARSPAAIVMARAARAAHARRAAGVAGAALTGRPA